MTTSKSLGIRTVQERIASIGGHLEFKLGKKKGTVVSLIIPKGD